MSFLPIVERELRVASRKPASYWMRSALALGTVVIWFSLLLASRASLSTSQRSMQLFLAIGILALFFCLCSGILLTSDCVSEERREGTLGLLFLTELKGVDVVLGKLVATSLNAFYGLLTILPILALPLLMGGVTVGEFWRVTIVLITTLMLSLAVGLVVSVISVETRQAAAATLLVLVVITGLLPVFYGLVFRLLNGQSWSTLLWPSPAYLFQTAFDIYFRLGTGPREFWSSLITVSSLAVGALAGASIMLPRLWRDKGKAEAVQTNGWLWRLRVGSPEFRLQRRRQWLQADPFYWLASRDRLTVWSAWAVLVPLFLLWLAFLAGCFGRATKANHMCFAICLFLAYGLHHIIKYFVAVEVSRRLSEDHRSGALETLLATPITKEQILDGQRRAIKEQFLGPMLLVLLTNTGLIWLLLGPNPLKLSGGDKLVFVELFVGGGLMMLLDFYAFSWIGMAAALSAKRHSGAIASTLGRVMGIPWLMVLFLVFLGMGGGFGSAEAAFVIFAFWFMAGIVADMAFVAKARTNLKKALRNDWVGCPAPVKMEPANLSPPLLTPDKL
ncbi:MAG TPA: ABC transporter permease subunit [Clostridia bacterium]|nr:ABC transporter permease subunit [Clostridia bacterium]